MIDVVEISILNIGEISNRILLFDNQYYYIEDNYFKIEDVKKMPDYISKDWFVYNRKQLTLDIINKHINKNNDDELKLELMSIRRNLFIDNVLK